MSSYSQEAYETLRVMRFSIGEIDFAIAIMEIREVIPMPEIRAIPKAPGFVEGVLSLRGEIIPVVDLRKLFGVEPKGTEYKVILREIKKVTVGYIVDQVSNVLQVDRKSILPPPPVIIQGLSEGCFYGLIDHQEENIILIDLSKAMGAREIEALGQLMSQPL